MKVLILTYGTRGDVQPFVALGRGLQARGDEVHIATSTRFEAFVTENGLGFCPVSDDLLAILDTRDGKDMLENTANFFDMARQYIRMAKRVGPMLEEQLEQGWQAGQRVQPDLVIYHPKGAAGPAIAEGFNAPAILALPFPMLIATGETPHLGFPKLPFGATYNRFSHHVVRAASALGLKGAMKKLRASKGLPKAKRYDALHMADGTRLPSMTCVSPSVVKRPQDWDEGDIITGYWFLDHQADWQPDGALTEFLQAGPPPVYIGFGSISGKRPEKLAEIAINALAASGQRGILATGWGGLKPSDLPDTVLQIDSAPHDWLFPRMACVVHHGGAGTTAAGLKAGVPSLIVPFVGDQPYWADKVFEIGAGPKGIPQKKLTAENLAAAISEAVTSEVIRNRAAELGALIRAEDGVATAIAHIDRAMGRRGL